MSDHSSISPLINKLENMDSGDEMLPQEGENQEESMAEASGHSGEADAPTAGDEPGEEEGQPQRPSSSPRLPGAREREEHELTHCPYRSWCEHCTKGQKKDFPHKKVTGELAESSVVRVSMDYCFFTEDVDAKEDDHEETVKAKVSLTVLVMVETLCRSVWAYAVTTKGAGEPSIADQIAEDL